MSLIQVLNVKLQRADQSVSWGFNVQGGKEFHSPLVIQKVNSNSLADRCSVRPNDFILRIGSIVTENLTHNQARDAIMRQGNNLELTLQRGAAPRPEDYTSRFDFPQHQLMNADSIEYKPVPAPPSSAYSGDYQQQQQKQQQLSPQVGVQLQHNKALLTQSYNSPMGLYSNQNLADTLVHSIKNLNINDPNLLKAAQNIRSAPPSNSSTSNRKITSTTTTVSAAALATNDNHNHNHNPSSSFSSLYLTKYNDQHKNNNNNFSSQAAAAAGPPQFSPVQYNPVQQYQPSPYDTNNNNNNNNYQPHRAPSGTAMPAPPRNQPPVGAGFPTVGGGGGGQRNINRGVKGSALLKSANPSSVPTCGACMQLIRGPFVSAVGKIWCPHHFVCAHPSCGMSLQDVGFVEENGKLYCERDFEAYFAPKCHKCHASVTGECCYALDKTYHPECFVCAHCKQKLGSGSFHIEDGKIYCQRDYSALFSTKCAGCEFPIEAGDKFLEALNQQYHVECFNCSTCNVPLTNTAFATKGNKPYCKKHAY